INEGEYDHGPDDPHRWHGSPMSHPNFGGGTSGHAENMGDVAGGLVDQGFVPESLNSASGLTCTLGTGTTCNDITHTVALTTSDSWSVRITTAQTGDTTANPRATFQCQ